MCINAPVIHPTPRNSTEARTEQLVAVSDAGFHGLSSELFSRHGAVYAPVSPPLSASPDFASSTPWRSQAPTLPRLRGAVVGTRLVVAAGLAAAQPSVSTAAAEHASPVCFRDPRVRRRGCEFRDSSRPSSGREGAPRWPVADGLQLGDRSCEPHFQL